MKYQQGYTFITLVLILGLIGIFCFLLFKIGPIYMDHSKVLGALSAVEKLPNLQELSESDIRSGLDKRFNLNYVSDIKAQDITVIKRGSYVKIEANYEVVKKLIGNLSALVNFHDVVEVGRE
ncbi:MAG: DUF4845 domain-containing protein [Gammaproteobacteria bacterium]|nr:DUF4845 domain-containing protein [Gammaproteobacteria bacterium]